LHDYLYLNNKLRTFSLFGFFIPHFTNTYGFSFERTDNIFANCIFVRIREIFKTNRETWTKIRYYKDVTLCENYVRDFFIAAILPVSVKFNAINLLILKMQRHQSRRHFGSK
jgi:hypothetical protein